MRVRQPRDAAPGRLAPALVAVAVLATLTGGVLRAGQVTAAAKAAPTSPARVAAGSSLPAADDLRRPMASRSRELATVPSAPASAAAAPRAAVSPLATLRAPDLLVTVRTPLSATQVGELQQLRQLSALSVVDIGTVRVSGTSTRMIGVDPSTFRVFTPAQTASSDALWQSVARGELAPDYELSRERTLALGSTVPVSGRSAISGRIGAVAAFGLPGVDVVTDRATARRLGIVPQSAVLVSAPDRSISALKRAVREVVGRDAVVDVLRPEVVRISAGKPRTYRDLYIASAKSCSGLSWTVLAAIGQIESGHGRNLGPSSAGALGPMQFMPGTWATYGLDGDGDGKADIMNPYDAIPSAAGYLCRFGAGRGEQGLYSAIFAYNHADWYVRQVLGLAAQYK